MDQLPEWIQGSWILKLAWLPLLGLVMGIIGKFCNKDKIAKKTLWIPALGAKTLSTFLRTYIGEAAENKLENGLVMTGTYVVRKWCDKFDDTLKADNKRRAEKKGSG